MGIAGTNREGMGKYRRFPENPKQRCRAEPFQVVKIGISGPNFLAPEGALADPFDDRGERFANAAVTDPLHEIARWRALPADSA